MEHSKKIDRICQIAGCSPSSKECHAIDSLKQQAKYGADPEEGWPEESWKRYQDRVEKKYLKDSKCYHPEKLKKALKEIKPEKFKKKD